MEACTYMNTDIRVPLGGYCKFWIDGNGNWGEGGKWSRYCLSAIAVRLFANATGSLPGGRVHVLLSRMSRAADNVTWLLWVLPRDGIRSLFTCGHS